jgi:hypothetical protein
MRLRELGGHGEADARAGDLVCLVPAPEPVQGAGSSSAGIPHPVSLSCSRASAPLAAVSTITWPPAGVNFTALVSTLVMIWCRRPGPVITVSG